jgi:tRNA threonylcarbamoyladenosine biosynthesis protein TsaB
MRFLIIEASTERGLIACFDKKITLFTQELPVGFSQSKFLMPALVEALTTHSVQYVDVIGIGVGPGSYTNIRVAVSVAQALAYSWRIPLVTTCSLDGFIPSGPAVSFVSLVDARMGGVYLRKGWGNEQDVCFETKPLLCSMEEVGRHLENVTNIITPCAFFLQEKMKKFYSNKHFEWQERAPCAYSIARNIKESHKQGEVIYSPQTLSILYLRQTEAERNKEKQRTINPLN